MKADSDVKRTKQARLDAQIVSLDAQIASLKAKYNELAPISRLPTEVLCIIFKACKPPIVHGRQSDELGKRGGEWATFKDVCQRWRNVALNCAELWSHLSSSMNQRWMKEMFARSNKIKGHFNVELDRSMREIPQVLIDVVSQTTRLAGLTLSCGPGDIQDLLACLGPSAPVLRHLWIKGTTYGGQCHNYALPDHFVNGDVPLLQTLQVVGCKVPWMAPLLKNLTFFCVYLDFEASPQIHATQLFDSLKMMPMLTQLELRMRLPDMGVLSRQIVNLPNLKSVFLTDSLERCVQLLEHIHFPPSTAITLHTFEMGSDVESNVLALGRVLSSAWFSTSLHPEQAQPPVTSLDFETNGGCNVIWGWPTIDDVALTRATEAALHLYFPGYPFSMVPSLTLVAMSILPLEYIQSLRYDGHFDHPSQWGNIFVRLRSVRSIYLTDFPQFLDCLLQDPAFTSERPSGGDEQNTSPAVKYLPRLESITFIRHRLPGPPPRLVELLQLRSEFGARVKRLTFEQPDFPLNQTEVQAIEAVVDELVFTKVDSAPTWF